VLEDEADEDVVERRLLEGQVEDVGWRSSTFSSPASSTRRRAAATESSARSIDRKRACGLRRASVTVWAPTPQPASSTKLPAG
jgi:hypothetical protein